MAITPPVLTAPAGAVMDADTGVLVWSKAPNSQLQQASTTKMTTLLLLLEYHPQLTDLWTVSSTAASMTGSKAGTLTGEVYALRELAYGLMLPSGNDCAISIAEYVGRTYLGASSNAAGVAAFVTRMNARAAELGCANTFYLNPHGAQYSGHYSSARDLCVIARALFALPTGREISGTVSRVGIAAANAQGTPRRWENTHSLLGPFQVAAGKQGWTPTANQCLTSLYELGGRRWVCAIIGAVDVATRNSETVQMLEYARKLSGVGGTLTGRSGSNHASAAVNWDYTSYDPGLYRDGYGRQCAVAGSTYEYTFWGTRAQLVAPTAPDRGIAEVALDGGAPSLMDQYSAAPTKGALVYDTGTLADGKYVLTLTATGTKQPASSGTLVAMDEVEVTRIVTAEAIPMPIVYDVQHGPASSGPWSTYQADLSATSATVDGLPTGARWFRIVARDTGTSETATSAARQLALQAVSVGGAIVYDVAHSTSSTGPWTPLATGVTGTALAVSGLPDGARWLQVQARDTGTAEVSAAAVSNVAIAAVGSVEPPAPAIRATPAGEISFRAAEGAGDPEGQPIAVANGGTGTLATVTASIVGGLPGWLQVSPLGALSVPATIVLQPVTGARAQGRYAATLRLASNDPGVTNSPQELAIVFDVVAPPSAQERKTKLDRVVAAGSGGFGGGRAPARAGRGLARR